MITGAHIKVSKTVSLFRPCQMLASLTLLVLMSVEAAA